MVERKQHDAHSRHPGPAVLNEKLLHLRKAVKLKDAPLRGVGHDYDGDDDLVRGKAEDKREQDDAVQPHQTGEGIQKRGAVRQYAHAAGGDICHQPDDKPRGRGHRGGSAEDKERSVEHRPDEHLSYLRLPVRRQLQREGGRNAPEQSFGQQLCHRERDAHAQHYRRSQKQRRQHRGQPSARRSDEEHGKQGDQRGEASVARHEVVGKYREQPFSGRVDDAAADDARRVAAEAHAHGKRLFSAGAAALEGFIQIICHSRQVARVLQQGKQREENGHRRQHYGHHPRQNAIRAEDEDAVQPIGRIEVFKQLRKSVLHPEQAVCQKLRRIVRAAYRQPEYQRQQGEHYGVAGEPSGQELI